MVFYEDFQIGVSSESEKSVKIGTTLSTYVYMTRRFKDDKQQQTPSLELDLLRLTTTHPLIPKHCTAELLTGQKYHLGYSHYSEFF